MKKLILLILILISGCKGCIDYDFSSSCTHQCKSKNGVHKIEITDTTKMCECNSIKE